jgi:hypothetical protein
MALSRNEKRAPEARGALEDLTVAAALEALTQAPLLTALIALVIAALPITSLPVTALGT